MDGFKHDSLQALSDRLQQLSDISSRFDALTKETEEKLHNVIETANVLQQKMTPINEQIEILRTRKRGYESCKLFLKQTSSYQVTTEKYIQEIRQSKINNVEDYVTSLTKAKESLDFFATYLPQEKNAENLQYIISDGSKSLREKFKEQLASITQTERLSPDKCLGLANCEPVNLEDFMPKFNEKQLQELRIITTWLDSQGKTADYLQIYIEVRSLSLCSTLKKFRDSLLGTSNSTFGASPSLPRRGGPRDTPSKATLQRRIKSKPSALAQQPSALGGGGIDTSDQPDLDSDDVNSMLTAFLRLTMLEAMILPRFSLKLDKPQQLVDLIVAKAKDTLFEDVNAFVASVRREFKQDPESLLRLVAVLDRLRRLRPELAAAKAAAGATSSGIACPPVLRASFEDLAKDMRAQARGSLEDFRDDIVKGGSSSSASLAAAAAAAAAAEGLDVVDDRRGGGPLLPADGTVHELTLMTLKFLQQLHEYGDTAHEILTRENPSAGSGTRAQDPQKAKILGAYLSQTLANLLRNLDTRSEQYSDPALRSIFLLNNYRYVQQRLERDRMTSTIQAYNYEAIRFFEEHQTKNRQSYLNRGWARVLEIVMEKTKPLSQQRMSTEMSGRLSDKEKALIKEKFKSFNEEFLAVHKTQSNYAVPDPELRSDLIRENKAFLLDKYSIFRDKYANVPFTAKKDKYIKFTREDVERLLEEFFGGV